MKYIYYNSCSFAHPHLGVLLDEAISKAKEGNEVIFSYCDGVLDSCFMNRNSINGLCKLCKLGYHSALDILPNNVRVIPIKKNSVKNAKYEFQSLSDIKSIKYRGVSIGYSILSLYITLTRDLELVMTNQTTVYLNHLINRLCSFVDYVYTLFQDENPDYVVIYSGRYYENRLFYDIAKAMNIHFLSNEIVGGERCGEEIYKVVFDNHLPLDIKGFSERINNTWKCSPLIEKDKIEIGELFFKRRKSGIPAGDKVYISSQKTGLLPRNYDISKKNIVIYNSSPDEFASVGEEWEADALFNSQTEALRFILSSFISNDEYHFYFRIHPNLKDIPFAYHTDLLALDSEFENLTIIKGEDSISSYALLDIAEKVLVFGSTMGVESVYWNKPTILLSKSLYYYLNICYIPDSRKMLLNLIGKKLLPMNRLPAIKYGFYILDRSVNVKKWENVDFNIFYFSFFGLKIKRISYLKFLGSTRLYKMLQLFLSKICLLFPKNERSFPGKVFKL